jgi:hypothetical protein
MALTEANLVIDYFHHSTPEHLEMLGVDPTRLPTPDAWRERFQHEFSLPLDKRLGFFVIWLLDDQAVGFSSCDKIVFGERANMHLHVAEPRATSTSEHRHSMCPPQRRNLFPEAEAQEPLL